MFVNTMKFCLIAGMIIGLAGCGDSGSTQQATGGDQPAAAVGDRASNSFTIKGSDTEVNLVQRLAEVYMNQNPGVEISVTGGGSGTGIAALTNKQTDLANSSRVMRDSEIEQARANGVNPVGVVFSMDGLAVIVNPENTVESLTIEQLGKIYSGEITQWSEVGGPGIPISLYGRQSNSGTYGYFRDTVVKANYSSNMKSMNGTAQIVANVKLDKAAIGYVGIGYAVNEAGGAVDGIKVLNLSAAEGEKAISPLDAEGVKSGVYPLSRPLYQYTDGVPRGAVLKFIQFELSDEGQAIIEGEGYYPVTSGYMEQNKALGIEQ